MLMDEFYGICDVDTILVNLSKVTPLIAQNTQPSLSIETIEKTIYGLLCAIVFEDVLGSMVKHMLCC